MVLSWRGRKSARGGRRENKVLGGISEVEITIPTHFRCPISLDLMRDPVTLSTGITYDRENIERWIESGNITCPVTNQVLRNFDQIPNHSIRKMIQEWCVANKAYGVERIPTPRVPITPYEVSEICLKISAATRRDDVEKCLELLGKLKNCSKESERNKKCIAGNGAGTVLASSFESFAHFSSGKHANLLKEMLSMLKWMFPLGEEGNSKLGSAVSLRCMARFLEDSEDLSSRQNAVLVLKELISLEPKYINEMMEIGDIVQNLFQMVKVPICPSSTKASLTLIYHATVSTKGDTFISHLVQMGLVPLVLETLVDGDKSMCEKGLAVLESICNNSHEGLETSRQNALTMPILVKKILRVSELATELSISIIWKLCCGEDQSPILEALLLGGFQKLLVVLQVGCGQRTKGKVTELLKLMNLYKDKLDCFDSTMGFRYVKRSG